METLISDSKYQCDNVVVNEDNECDAKLIELAASDNDNYTAYKRNVMNTQNLKEQFGYGKGHFNLWER